MVLNHERMRRMTFSHEIIEAIERALTEEIGDFTYDEASGIFDIEIDEDDEELYASQFILVRGDAAIFYTVYNYAVPVERIGAVADFLMRANQGLYNGNFELDFQNEVVMYKSYIPCYTPPDKQAIVDCVNLARNLIIYYSDALVDVINGKPPAIAVTEAESEEEAE